MLVKRRKLAKRPAAQVWQKGLTTCQAAEAKALRLIHWYEKAVEVIVSAISIIIIPQGKEDF